MTRIFPATILLLLAGALAPPTFGGSATVPEPAALHAGAAPADTVHVAPPTGETEADRASILAALERVMPGGTIQFEPGTYLVGEIIPISIPRITILGHPEGTILRGCELAAYEEMSRDLSRARDWSESWAAMSRCGVLELTGGRVTVRNLTFENTDRGLGLGCCLGEPAFRPSGGGYLIENNTFRNSRNGIRASLASADTTVIRKNQFINVYHAVSAAVSHFHVVDNDIFVREPEQVPGIPHPGFAILLEPVPPGPGGTVTATINVCEHNVIAGNRIEGHPDGIFLSARPGTRCRHNVIRDNTIAVRRVRLPASRPYAGPARITNEADSTVVGVPLALFNDPVSWVGDDSAPQGIFESNRIEGNRIMGAEGLGIVVYRASRNRVVNNTITGVTVRDPHPGNTIRGSPPEREWDDANGSGIWISPGSEDNEIVGNTFEDVAGADVFLEGDRNRVALRSAADSVLDLGTGNRVTAPDPASEALDSRPGPTGLDPWPSDVSPGDTVRYTGIVNGMTGGERRMWREGPDTWAYSCDMSRSCFPRTERLELDDDGLPVRLEVSGQKAPWAPWEERFERQGPVARWTTPVDEGEQPVEGPRFYAALYPAHDPGVLARALLRQPSRRLLLLPEGEARLEALGERTVERDGRTRTVRHYAVHGLDLKPAYVWLDEDGATFTDEWMVRVGWESVFPQLKAASRTALADHVRGLARRLMPPPRDRPLAIRGARLFDPTTGSVRAGTTILVEGSRIAAVGGDGSLPVPDDADVIDAAGRTLLPGLWDMHTHHGTGYLSFFRYRELDAPLHLAGGVTTARDLGSHIDELTSLRSRIESGEAIGPRLLAAGYIDGVGGSRTGVQVGTPEEARAAVDRFAELGYVQIKIYGELPADLVPVVIERARGHALRVSGHVPRSLSAREAVEAGFDELQHVGIFVSGILGSLDELIVRWEDDWEGWADAQVTLQPGTPAVREFVELLAAEDVALDPTLALALASEVPPHYVAPVLGRFPPQARRRLLERSSPPSPLEMERRDAYVSSWTGLVRVAHEAGVPILPGTDLMPGFGLHRELELYVEAGIPAPEVLTLATLGAARVMGMDDELGSIEPGKLADLILVDGDPTADISGIRRVVTVIKDGRVYDPAVIYRALGIEPCCNP
jgi:parallel beta-helix repeat protein